MLEELLEFEPVVASPDELLDDMIRRMADGNVTVVPVIDKVTGELVGSITDSDVMASVIGERKHGRKWCRVHQVESHEEVDHQLAK